MSNNHKGGRRGFRNFKQQKQQNKNENDTNAENTEQKNAIISSFKNYSMELDDKHDRYERIVKLSRDITIESKRIIFLLHTVDPKKENTEKILKEAEERLQTLCSAKFLAIAKELGDLDPYQYGRAYSAGLQEFVEAHTFYEYLSKKKISNWEKLQEKLNYNVQESATELDEIIIKSDSDKSNKDLKDFDKDEQSQPAEEIIDASTSIEMSKKYICRVQPIEFILGLSDVGGEIMRRCINSLGSGDIGTCFESCRSLQELYAGYLGINMVRGRELSRKIYTMKQSVLKTENVCYNVKVRGGEAAKWGSARDTYSEKHFDEDEGFF